MMPPATYATSPPSDRALGAMGSNAISQLSSIFFKSAGQLVQVDPTVLTCASCTTGKKKNKTETYNFLPELKAAAGRNTAGRAAATYKSEGKAVISLLSSNTSLNKSKDKATSDSNQGGFFCNTDVADNPMFQPLSSSLQQNRFSASESHCGNLETK